MNRNNRSESVAPVKGDDRVREVKQELATLGEIKTQYEDEIKKGKKLASDYFDLDEKVEKKKAELSSVSFDLSEIIRSAEKLKSIEKQIDERKVEIEEIDLDAMDKSRYEIARRDKINIDITNLSNKQEKLEKEINKLEDKKDDVDDEYHTMKERYDSGIETLDDEVFTRKEHIAELEDEIEELDKEVSELTNSRGSLTLKVDGLEMAIKDEEKSLVKVKEETSNHMSKKIYEFDGYKVGVEDKLKIREGACSDKEKFLNIREELLRSVKEQLEDKLGKKINNIDF